MTKQHMHAAQGSTQVKRCRLITYWEESDFDPCTILSASS